MKKRWLQRLFVAVIIVAGIYFSWSIGTTIWNAFSGANDSVKTASIAAFVSVFTFFAGRYFEQNREVRSKSNIEKVRIYERFFELYFGMFSVGKPGGVPIEPEKVIQEFLTFQKELMLWGSDGVIAAYLDYKDAMTRFDVSPSDDMAIRLAAMIKSAARLLVEMRRDVGYKFTTVNAKTLARLQLADPETDPDIKTLIKNL